MINVAMVLNHQRLQQTQNYSSEVFNLVELFQKTQQIGAFQIRVIQSLSQVLFSSLHRDDFWRFWASEILQELDNWNDEVPELCLTPGIIPLQADRNKWQWREIIVIQAIALKIALQLAKTVPSSTEALDLLLGIKDALVEDSSMINPKGFGMVPLGLPLLEQRIQSIEVRKAAIDPALKKLPSLQLIVTPSSPAVPEIGQLLTRWLWEMNRQYGAEMSYLGLLFIAEFGKTKPFWQSSIQYQGTQLLTKQDSETDTTPTQLKHLARQLEIFQQCSVLLEERELEKASVTLHEAKMWHVEGLSSLHDLEIEGEYGIHEYQYTHGVLKDLSFAIAPGNWCQRLIQLFDREALTLLKEVSQISKQIINLNPKSHNTALSLAIFILKEHWQGHSCRWSVKELIEGIESPEKIQAVTSHTARHHGWFQEWDTNLSLLRTLGWEISENPLSRWNNEPPTTLDWLTEIVTISVSSMSPPKTQVPDITASEAEKPAAIKPQKRRKMDEISSHALERALSIKGMSQATLARSLNLDRSTINRWINGSRPIHAKYLPVLWEILGHELQA